MISGGCVEMVEAERCREEGYPYVEILEQPASKALRFRYECEGRSAGSIPGANSTPEYKTYPTIRIRNYSGRGVVVVSCVTKDQPYRAHPHSLVGKGACKAGVCRMEITPGNPTVSFVNLGIQCVKKKDIAEALRVREKIRVDPYKTGFDHKAQTSSVDLNSVRMCFQVFIEGKDGKLNVPLRPVVSEPIYDKKAMSDLMICKLSHYSASAAGGTEMIVLCEKVAKDNIQVRFFEKRDGREVWEGYGDFKSIHVHKQVAITFRTPGYHDRQIEEPVQVFVQLKRPTDGATSEPLPFKLLPLDTDDHDCLRRKRRKFGECPRAQVLRRLQSEAESQGILLSEPIFECAIDPLKLEVRAQTSPSGGTVHAFNEAAHSLMCTPETPVQSPASPAIDVASYVNQDSPVSLPSPAMGYGAYNGYPNGGDHQGNEEFETARNNQAYPQQMECSPFANYYHQQQHTHQGQQTPVHQKLSALQQNFHRNGQEQNHEHGAVGELIDIDGHQQSSLDASLNQLDSAELAAFGVVLSDSLSSGLLLNDHPVKIENNMTSGTIPVSVGAAASWCDL